MMISAVSPPCRHEEAIRLSICPRGNANELLVAEQARIVERVEVQEDTLELRVSKHVLTIAAAAADIFLICVTTGLSAPVLAGQALSRAQFRTDASPVKVLTPLTRA
jgi:hypothetical protein